MTLMQFIGYAKKFCVALVAALTVLAAALSDQVVTNSEWVQILAAFIGAIGVYTVTNERKI